MQPRYLAERSIPSQRHGPAGFATAILQSLAVAELVAASILTTGVRPGEGEQRFRFPSGSITSRPDVPERA